MTRIDFYHSVQDKQNFALRLAEKCWQQQSPLFVLLPDSSTLAAFDQALWERRPESFIPHAIWSIDREQPEPAIWLGESVPHLLQHGILLNLQTQATPAFARFQRCLEIVSLDPEDRQFARQRYQHFVRQGYLVNMHDMAAHKAQAQP